MTRYDTTYMPLPSPRPSNCLMRSRPSRPLHRPINHRWLRTSNIPPAYSITPIPVHHQQCPSTARLPSCVPPSSIIGTPSRLPAAPSYPSQYAHASPSVDTYPLLPSQQHITTHHITSHRIASHFHGLILSFPSHPLAPHAPTPPLLS